VRAIANELIRIGKIDRGAIGIGYNLLTPRAAAALGLPAQTQGVIVGQILPGSPAAQVGLKVNDVITKVNDQQIDATHPISSILLRTRPGDKVTLTLIRDGNQQIVEVTLGRQS
jgi:serine protease Do